MNTVNLIPILSTNIPAIGEQHNVEPNVRDPINAKSYNRISKHDCSYFTVHMIHRKSE